jgi:hypothetical protein
LNNDWTEVAASPTPFLIDASTTPQFFRTRN